MIECISSEVFWHTGALYASILLLLLLFPEMWREQYNNKVGMAYVVEKNVIKQWNF